MQKQHRIKGSGNDTGNNEMELFLLEQQQALAILQATSAPTHYHHAKTPRRASYSFTEETSLTTDSNRSSFSSQATTNTATTAVAAATAVAQLMQGASGTCSIPSSAATILKGTLLHHQDFPTTTICRLDAFSFHDDGNNNVSSHRDGTSRGKACAPHLLSQSSSSFNSASDTSNAHSLRHKSLARERKRKLEQKMLQHGIGVGAEVYERKQQQDYSQSYKDDTTTPVFAPHMDSFLAPHYHSCDEEQSSLVNPAPLCNASSGCYTDDGSGSLGSKTPKMSGSRRPPSWSGRSGGIIEYHSNNRHKRDCPSSSSCSTSSSKPGAVSIADITSPEGLDPFLIRQKRKEAANKNKLGPYFAPNEDVKTKKKKKGAFKHNDTEIQSATPSSSSPPSLRALIQQFEQQEQRERDEARRKRRVLVSLLSTIAVVVCIAVVSFTIVLVSRQRRRQQQQGQNPCVVSSQSGLRSSVSPVECNPTRGEGEGSTRGVCELDLKDQCFPSRGNATTSNGSNANDPLLMKTIPTCVLDPYQDLLENLIPDIFPPTRIGRTSSFNFPTRSCHPANLALLQMASHYDALPTSLQARRINYLLGLFYFATNGPTQWKDRRGWISPNFACGKMTNNNNNDPEQEGWQNVACNGNGNVVSLDLRDNGIGGTIPTEIGLLGTSLKHLLLTRNKVGGTLPSQLGMLSRLERLDLRANKIGGRLPSELNRLTVLQELELSENNFNGPLPTEICQIPELQIFNIYNNKLTGTLPTDVGSFQHLTILLLSQNNFRGTLPTELGYLTTLQEIGFEENNLLSGTIPTEVGTMRNLKHLFLVASEIEGTLPTEISNLRFLENLVLAKLSLTGTIPTEFSKLTFLQTMNLNGNKLGGSIPETLEALGDLEELNLAFNQLTGAFPTFFPSLSKLRVLQLHSNFINGIIPANTCRGFETFRADICRGTRTQPLLTCESTTDSCCDSENCDNGQENSPLG